MSPFGGAPALAGAGRQPAHAGGATEGRAPHVLRLGQPLGLAMAAVTPVRVKVGRFVLNAAVNALRPADRLYVTFHGTRRSGKSEGTDRSPLFWGMDRHDLFQAPLLAISDPLAEKVWGAGMPRIATYFGTFAHDLMPELNALVDQVCEELGVARGHCVMYGAGSGGTAALLAGAARPCKASVIAVNPQMRVDKYPSQMIALAARAMGGTAEQWLDTLDRQPGRMDPGFAMRHAMARGADFRAVLAHAAGEAEDRPRRWLKTLKQFGLGPQGGVDATGRVLALSFGAVTGAAEGRSEVPAEVLTRAVRHFGLARPGQAAPGA